MFFHKKLEHGVQFNWVLEEKNVTFKDLNFFGISPVTHHPQTCFQANKKP